MIKKVFIYAGWMYSHSKGVRLRVAVNVCIGMVNVALSMGFVLVSKALVDTATGVRSGNLLFLAILAGAVMLLRALLGAFASRLENVTSSKLNFTLRRNLFDLLIHRRWDGRDSRHSGDLINRLESDVSSVVSVICTDIPYIAVTVVQLLAAVALLCTMDARLAAFLVIMTPLLLLLSKSFFRKVRGITGGIRESEGKIQSHLQESLRHGVMLRAMENEDAVASRMDALQGEEYSSVVKRANVNVFARILVSVAFAGGYLAAFLRGVYGISAGKISFGVMTSFLQLVGQIQRPLSGMIRQIPSLVYATSSIDRLMEIENIPQEEKSAPVMMDAPIGIRISGLHFSYPDSQRDIYKGLSADFAPGSRVAVVGETGAGKSTLVRLMLSILKPSSGTLELYNDSGAVPVSASTRCNFVYVPQGNSLLSGTVRENLLIGDPDADESRMRDALHTAAAEFVMDLPDGLDTAVGEGGAGLSEGQAQRIAIARALLRPGSILLLDEFSSSLDPETEETLMDRLNEKAAGKTIVFITHRQKISSRCNVQCRIESA